MAEGLDDDWTQCSMCVTVLQ